jgi:hypothetical protein
MATMAAYQMNSPYSPQNSTYALPGDENDFDIDYGDADLQDGVDIKRKALRRDLP